VTLDDRAETWVESRDQHRRLICTLTRRMANRSAIDQLARAFHRERRTNRRMRDLINELREHVHENRRELDIQRTRMAQIQIEVDVLKGRL